MKAKTAHSRIFSFELILADIFIIMLSMFFSWLVRRQFSLFLFDLHKFFLFLPIVLVVRLSVNRLLEHYSGRGTNFQIRDIHKLIRHNFIPTVAFLILRLTSPVSELRMPLTMIFIEFVGTTLGMVLWRSFLSIADSNNRSRLDFAVNAAYFTARIIPTRLKKVRAVPRWFVAGVFSRNRLDWNFEIDGIRTFGSPMEISSSFVRENFIQIFLLDGSLPLEERTFLFGVAARNNVQLRILAPDLSIRSVGPYDLIEDGTSKDQYIPDEAGSRLVNQKLLVLGKESVLFQATLEAVLQNWQVEYRAFGLLESFPEPTPVCFVLDLRPHLAASTNLVIPEYQSAGGTNWLSVSLANGSNSTQGMSMRSHQLTLPRVLGPRARIMIDHGERFCSDLVAIGVLVKTTLLCQRSNRPLAFFGGGGKTYFLDEQAQIVSEPLPEHWNGNLEWVATNYSDLLQWQP